MGSDEQKSKIRNQKAESSEREADALHSDSWLLTTDFEEPQVSRSAGRDLRYAPES
jgi:hypothetical protein